MISQTETRCAKHHLLRCVLCEKSTVERNTFGLNIKIPLDSAKAAQTPESAEKIAIGTAETSATEAAQPTALPIFVMPAKYENVPLMMREKRNWVNYLLVPKVNADDSPMLKADGSQKMDKVPYNPASTFSQKQNAKSNDPQTWGTFEQAVANEAGFSGIGFMLGTKENKSGVVGVDFDDCIATKKIQPWAKSALAEVNSYTEVSPSITGLHAFVRGEVPSAAKIGFAEIYDFGRFLTVTGKRLNQYPAEVRPYDCLSLHGRIKAGEFDFSPKSAKTEDTTDKRFSSAVTYTPDNLTAEQKIELFTRGEIISAGHPFTVQHGDRSVTSQSQSEIDLSLATFLVAKHQGDTDGANTDFRLSVLMRPKWERDDYRTRTLTRALESYKARENEKPIFGSTPVQQVATAVLSPDELVARDPDECSPLSFLDEIPKEAASLYLSQVAASHGIAILGPSRVVEDAEGVSQIPAFDPSVMEGNIYGKFVELVTAGTTLQPQYAYQMARLAVSMMIVGRVNFEGLADVPPLRRLVFLGETGSGKGESYRRSKYVLTMGGKQTDRDFKITESIDSGAGLKDMFFDPPLNLPILFYADEVTSLGHKSSDRKNPEILDTMGELANSTTVSRTLSTHGGGGKKKASKTMNGAYLFWIMCAPDGMTFMCATAGRKTAGFNDRNIPVFGVPVVAGELPAIPERAIAELWVELYKIQSMVGTPKQPGTASMTPEAKALLEDFWRRQPEAIQKKVRFKQYLLLDAYLNAIGRERMSVLPQDAEDAIKDARGELATRAACFQEEAGDRVGFYYAALKRLTAQMEAAIRKAGPNADPFEYGRSESDFEHDTRAFANNEPEPFSRAWKAFVKRHLAQLDPRTTRNGRQVVRFIPALPERD